MSRERKLLERLRDDPRDIRAEELFDVLRAEGVAIRRHGSHVGLTRGDARMTMALPHDGGHVKAPYVLRALKTFGLDRATGVEEAARRSHAEVRLSRTDDGAWLAEAKAMPGCLTHGATRAEALGNMSEAKACWLALGQEGEQA